MSRGEGGTACVSSLVIVLACLLGRAEQMKRSIIINAGGGSSSTIRAGEERVRVIRLPYLPACLSSC